MTAVELTQEEKRPIIARVCGWTWLDLEDDADGCYALSPKGERHGYIPDYFNDLNAIHEAEKTLTEKQRADWTEHVAAMLGMSNAEYDSDTSRFIFAHLTAAQRAEAFGLTLSLWP